MTHSSPVNATATAKCKHEELCFHSGGHYVYCPACRGWWVARADAHTSDERIDFNRAANSDVIGGEVRVRRTAVPAQQPENETLYRRIITADRIWYEPVIHAQAKPLSELEGEAWERGYQHGLSIPNVPAHSTGMPSRSALKTALGFMRHRAEKLEETVLTVSGSGEGAEIYRDACRCIEAALAFSSPEQNTAESGPAVTPDCSGADTWASALSPAQGKTP